MKTISICDECHRIVYDEKLVHDEESFKEFADALLAVKNLYEVKVTTTTCTKCAITIELYNNIQDFTGFYED
jgi:major membrane immunogen (membrane-anchored lipoprotein)